MQAHPSSSAPAPESAPSSAVAPAASNAATAAAPPSPFTFAPSAFAPPPSADASGAASLFQFASAGAGFSSSVNPFALPSSSSSSASASSAPAPSSAASAPFVFHGGSFSSAHRHSGGRSSGGGARASAAKAVAASGAGAGVAPAFAPAPFSAAAISFPIGAPSSGLQTLDLSGMLMQLPEVGPAVAAVGQPVAAPAAVAPDAEQIYVGLTAQGKPVDEGEADDDGEADVKPVAEQQAGESLVEGRFGELIKPSSMANFKCKGRGAAAEAAQPGAAEQPGAAARAIAMAARTKVKVTSRRSAGPAAASDAASSSGASSSSSASVPAPVVYTALNLSHTNAWIDERALWDQQDGGFDGDNRTADAIRATLVEEDVAAVLIDLILEFAEPPFVSMMSGTVQQSASLLEKLRPLRPAHSLPIACSLDVFTLSSHRLQLTLRELAESTEESLQRASRLTAEFLANEREARETISNELHRNLTCGNCGMEPIRGPAWIGSLGSGFEHALCNSCKIKADRGASSSTAFTRVCGFVPAAQREALANPSAPESAPAPPLVLSLPKSLVLEIYLNWQKPERGHVAIPLAGWSDLQEFQLQSSVGPAVAGMDSESFAEAVERALRLTNNGEPLAFGPEHMTAAKHIVSQVTMIQRAALFWKHAPGWKQAAAQSDQAQSSMQAPDGLQFHHELVAHARREISMLQAMQNMQVGPHAANANEIQLVDDDDDDDDDI